MSRPRDVFEAACHAAISRYKQDVAGGVYPKTADNTLVDAILRAWEHSHLERTRYATRGIPQAVTSPEAAAARVRAKQVAL